MFVPYLPPSELHISPLPLHRILILLRVLICLLFFRLIFLFLLLLLLLILHVLEYSCSCFYFCSCSSSCTWLCSWYSLCSFPATHDVHDHSPACVLAFVHNFAPAPAPLPAPAPFPVQAPAPAPTLTPPSTPSYNSALALPPRQIDYCVASNLLFSFHVWISVIINPSIF